MGEAHCPHIHPLKPIVWVESRPGVVEGLPAREPEWRCDKAPGHRGLCEHLTEMGGIVVWAPEQDDKLLRFP